MKKIVFCLWLIGGWIVLMPQLVAQQTPVNSKVGTVNSVNGSKSNAASKQPAKKSKQSVIERIQEQEYIAYSAKRLYSLRNSYSVNPNQYYIGSDVNHNNYASVSQQHNFLNNQSSTLAKSKQTNSKQYNPINNNIPETRLFSGDSQRTDDVLLEVNAIRQARERAMQSMQAPSRTSSLAGSKQTNSKQYNPINNNIPETRLFSDDSQRTDDVLLEVNAIRQARERAMQSMQAPLRTPSKMQETGMGLNSLSYDTWKIKENDNLRTRLYEWSKKAGWSLVWRSDYDYQIVASADFQMEFLKAIYSLFDSLGHLTPPLYVRIYPENRVILVDSQPDN